MNRLEALEHFRETYAKEVLMKQSLVKWIQIKSLFQRIT